MNKEDRIELLTDILDTIPPPANRNHNHIAPSSLKCEACRETLKYLEQRTNPAPPEVSSQEIDLLIERKLVALNKLRNKHWAERRESIHRYLEEYKKIGEMK